MAQFHHIKPYATPYWQRLQQEVLKSLKIVGSYNLLVFQDKRLVLLLLFSFTSQCTYISSVHYRQQKYHELSAMPELEVNYYFTNAMLQRRKFFSTVPYKEHHAAFEIFALAVFPIEISLSPSVYFVFTRLGSDYARGCEPIILLTTSSNRAWESFWDSLVVDTSI